MVAPTAPSPPLEPIAQAIESSAPSLPHLSPPDHALITRLLALNEDYPALAAQLTTAQDARAEAPRSPGLHSPSVPSCLSASVPSDLLSLLAWSAQPHITAWLTFYHHLQDQHSRRVAITELETLLKASDNPIEKRRTATTLLRALDHKWPTERRRALVNPDRQAAGSPWRGGARNPFPPSSRSSAPSSPRLTSITHSPPSPPHSPPPAPSITPSPSHTPETLARTIATDLSTGNLLQTAATLAAISNDKLRSNADTIITHLEPHLGLPADAHISPPAYHKPTPPFRHACKVTITNSSRTLTLSFTKPHNAPWLLNSLDTT